MISENELEDARINWGDALVGISEAFDEHGLVAAARLANRALDSTYGYELGPVLFKPTMASGDTVFRPTREGALAYFIGHNDKYPQDHGFGLRSWRRVESTTSAIFVEDDVAMWMGNVTFVDKNHRKTLVDKSWGYKRGPDGSLRIVLHHSSFPYLPD